MQISSFSINSDGTELDLEITDAASLGSLRLWTDKTYKNFARAIDLSDKLTGSATEVITITLADISEPYFDGIYFIEAEDEDEVSIEYTWHLTRLDECIVKLTEYLSACNDCFAESKEVNQLLSAAAILDGLKKALSIRYIDQILYFKKTLDKFCTSDCVSCGKFSKVTTNSSEDLLGGGSITISVDGGGA